MILVLDNYDSFTYNLVHMVAGGGSEVDVVRNDQIDLAGIRQLSPDGILISPGPGRPEEAGITKSVISDLGGQFPILGVCLGHQAIGEVYGGNVVHANVLMHGKTSLIRHDSTGVFAGVENDFQATRYHSLVVDPTTVPECLRVTATTADGTVMGLRHRQLSVEGIQFHPESVLTRAGAKLIGNWLSEILDSGGSQA